MPAELRVRQTGEVTKLLRAWRAGDQAALERLTPLVYDDLRRRARHYLRGERANHTLTPTALVHEAFMRMLNIGQVDWKDRAHFLAIAARQMRRILVDSARARRYQKRGGGAVRVTFTEDLPVIGPAAPDLVALDDALDLYRPLEGDQFRLTEIVGSGGANGTAKRNLEPSRVMSQSPPGEGNNPAGELTLS